MCHCWSVFDVLLRAWQIVALPSVDAVARGLVRTCDLTPCTNRVDIWALGVTIYELLTGETSACDSSKAQVCLARPLLGLRLLDLTAS